MENPVRLNSEGPENNEKLLGSPIGRALRRRFIAGIITIIPIAVTIAVIYFVFKWTNRIFLPLIVYLFAIENKLFSGLVSLFLALVLIYFIGLLSSVILVKRMIELGEKILYRIPIIKFFYMTTKKLVDTIAAPQKSAFRKVVLVEYPRKGIWGVGFVTGEMRFGDSEKLYINIFLPTTPNPTTGFFLILPKEDVWDTNWNLEEGIKIILSGGIVAPERVELKGYEPMAECEKAAAIR